MRIAIPQDTSLSEPVRLRIYEADHQTLAKASAAADLDQQEIARRALHLGLQLFAADLGVPPTPTRMPGALISPIPEPKT